MSQSWLSSVGAEMVVLIADGARAIVLRVELGQTDNKTGFVGSKPSVLTNKNIINMDNKKTG